jgi:SAM-dependent methyltransferase
VAHTQSVSTATAVALEDQLPAFVETHLHRCISLPALLELREAARLMEGWAPESCATKPSGGMEEWARRHRPDALDADNSCAWYHGTWQHLRLLDMVATPPWYAFYPETLGAICRTGPRPRVMIAAAADYGMLAAVHQAVVATGAAADIVVYDICETPLRSCRWYADRHHFTVHTERKNLLTDPIPPSTFDLVVTDEFLTVVPAEWKKPTLARWLEVLKPGGFIVTTAMIGGPTTDGLRTRYARRARGLLERFGSLLGVFGGDPEHDQRLLRRVDRFAALHTRHMVHDESEIGALFGDFTNLTIERIETPGECVNPTDSFQISAQKRDG